MNPKVGFLLVGFAGLGVGLCTGLYLRSPAGNQARYIDLTNANSRWKNGDIAYLRRHGDTTVLEKYFGGNYQKHPNNIRIVTIFDSSAVLWQGKASDLPPSTIQAIRQEINRQGALEHKNREISQDTTVAGMDAH